MRDQQPPVAKEGERVEPDAAHDNAPRRRAVRFLPRERRASRTEGG